MHITTLAILAATIASAHPAAQEPRNRSENRALLGIVTTVEKGGVTIASVLPDSPAAAAELEAGDVLLAIGKQKIERPTDVDDALRGAAPASKVKIRYRKGGKSTRSTEAKLIARDAYAGDFLARRETGAVDFPAPAWWGYAWHNVSAERPAPTLESTRGKVVVFHAFQSWCPGCHERGFPGHRQLEQRFAGAEDVVLFHLQTVWEAEDTNTPERGPREAAKFGIEVPVGYDAHVDGARLSVAMQQFGTGGTPWTIVIDKHGVVRINEVTPADVGAIGDFVEALRDPDAKPESPAPAAAEADPTDLLGMAVGSVTAFALTTSVFASDGGWSADLDLEKLPPTTLALWNHERENLVASLTDCARYGDSVDAVFRTTKQAFEAGERSGQLQLHVFDHEAQDFVGDGAWTWTVRNNVTQYVARVVRLGGTCFMLKCSRRLSRGTQGEEAFARELVETRRVFADALDRFSSSRLWFETRDDRQREPGGEFTIAGRRLRMPELPGWKPDENLGLDCVAAWDDPESGRRARLLVAYRAGDPAGVQSDRVVAVKTLRDGDLRFCFELSAPAGGDAVRAALEALAGGFALVE